MANDYSSLISAAEQKYGLPPGVLAGLIQTESAGNPSATSPQGAQGLTQVMPANDASLGLTQPYNAAQSIDAGAKLLAQNLKASGGDVVKALKMYHGGPDTSQWGPKTNAYPGKVLSNMPQTQISGDDILSLAGAAPAASTAQPAQTQPSQPISGDDLLSLATPPKAAAPAAEAPKQSWSDYLKDQFGLVMGQYKDFGKKVLDANDKAGAGIVYGVKSVIDKPAEWLINHEGQIPQNMQNFLTAHGVSPETAQTLFPTGKQNNLAGLISDQPSQAQQQDDAMKANLLATYGNTPQFELGKVAGQTAVTAPILRAGGALVNGGVSALASGLNEVSPAVGRVVQGVGNFLEGQGGQGATGVSGVVQRAASKAAAGAANGAGFNALTGQPVGVGAAVGGAVGGGVSPIADAAKSAAQSAIPMLDNETRQLVQKAENLGIKLRAPQITDAPFVRYADSTLRTLPAMGYGDTDAALRGQFNGALAKQMGQDATKITPQVMQNAKQTLGAQYDAITPQLSIKPDETLLSKLADIQGTASQTITDQELGLVNKQIDNVLNGFKEGSDMPGEYAHNLIKKGSPLDRLMNSTNPNVAHIVGDIRSALNDAMQRNAPPEVADALAQTNAQYKAMKTIEPLVAKSPTGDISPAALMSQVNKSYGGMAYNGGGDMGDLARIGQRFLKEPPQSGTSPRQMIMNALGGIGGIGAIAASPEVGLSHIAAGAGLAGTVAAGRGLKQLINSDAYYNALMGRQGEPVTNWLLQR